MQGVSIVQGLWAAAVRVVIFNAHETTIKIHERFGHENPMMKVQWQFW